MALLYCSRDFCSDRISKADQSEKFELKVMFAFWPIDAHVAGFRYTEHPQAVARHRVDLRSNFLLSGIAQMTEIDDGFRGSFCRDDVRITVGCFPRLRHCAQLGR